MEIKWRFLSMAGQGVPDSGDPGVPVLDGDAQGAAMFGV